MLFHCINRDYAFCFFYRQYSWSNHESYLQKWGTHGTSQKIPLVLPTQNLWDQGTSPRMIDHQCGSWRQMSLHMSQCGLVRCMTSGTPFSIFRPTWLASQLSRWLSLSKCIFQCVWCPSLVVQLDSMRSKGNCSSNTTFLGPSGLVLSALILCVCIMSGTFMRTWRMCGENGGYSLLLNKPELQKEIYLVLVVTIFYFYWFWTWKRNFFFQFFALTNATFIIYIRKTLLKATYWFCFNYIRPFFFRSLLLTR